MPRLPALFLLALAPAAQALCTSDDVPPPRAVLERFISADCADCWRDAATPRPAAGALALDWIVASRKGADAPLAAAASDDALARLRALQLPEPQRSSATLKPVGDAPVELRLAQGAAVNDYVAVSIALKDPGREPWTAWLLLVETLPAGTEGSPVERNLVRKVFQPDWSRVVGRAPGPLSETRTMQIPEGARPERLRLVAVLQDARGRIRGIRRTECP